MLWMFQRVNYGPVTNEKNANLPDLTLAGVDGDRADHRGRVLMGVLPNVFLKPIEPSVERMIAHMQQNASMRVRAER